MAWIHGRFSGVEAAGTGGSLRSVWVLRRIWTTPLHRNLFVSGETGIFVFTCFLQIALELLDWNVGFWWCR